MKRIKHIVMWLLIAGYLAVILGFVGKEEEKLNCTGVNIIIHDSLDLQFVDAGMITGLIRKNGKELAGRAIEDIDLQEIENRILSVRAVRTAEVYFTVRGKLVIEVCQRNPVVRIIDRSGQGFYIDEEGYIIPTSRNFCSHVLVANGKISEGCSVAKNIDEQGKGMDLLRDIYKMVNYIRDDEFWQSQILQIYINDKQEFELIPRVGAHIIEFGSADDMETKFDKLWVLYDEGFRNKGWNQYDRINLKYRNQVVCTKR
jgi:cell division protein FtsQ